jgi:DNA-binding transcriptional MocR family regulator
MYVPGELCFGPTDGRRPQNHMRLSFGVQTPEGIRTGMASLAAAVREVL